jgi:hypothetical protein
MSNQQYYGGSFNQPGNPYAQGGPPQQQQPQSFQPSHPQRTDTIGMPQGQERAQQVETMQQYESTAPQSQDDKDQEILRREFPSVDSTLIAAIYGDSKSLGATREMLMELTREG